MTVNHMYALPNDLPENGADLMHFNLVHAEILPGWNSLLAPIWHPDWEAANLLDIDKVEHPLPYVT
jgi:hypothetical protein